MSRDVAVKAQNVYCSAPYRKSLSRDGPVLRINSPAKKRL
jgi:hypothetical protein